MANRLSLAERLGKLTDSQDKWRSRNENQTPEPKPKTDIKNLMAKLGNSQEDWRHRVRKDDPPSKSSPRKSAKLDLFQNIHPQATAAPSKANTIYNLDSGLGNFFAATTTPVTTNESAIPDVADVDLDSIKASQKLTTPRRPVSRPGRPGARKALVAAAERLQAIEAEPVFCEEDARDHLIIEKILDDDRDQPIATSARRGLQSIENFDLAKSALKQADPTSPFPELMLIRIMGEKLMDVRLVCPKASSVHQHAAFLVVTPNRLLAYNGAYSNIIEKNKAVQISKEILQKKDLFCAAKSAETYEGDAPAFFKVLGGGSPNEAYVRPAEAFEKLSSEVNLVLRVTDDYRVTTVAKGERPKFRMLQPKETLIFDFGSEIYVWSGREARKTNGNYAKEYAKKLAKNGFSCQEAMFGCEMRAERPNWTILRRLHQGIQDILFSSKFSDWQSSELKHMMRTPVVVDKYACLTPQRRDPEDQAGALASRLRASEHPAPSLNLENFDFERETKDVITEDIRFWRLKDEELEEIEKTNVLWSDQCYVVRWQYRIQLSGIRRLNNGEEVERETGRERLAYFYWLGRETTPKQQGLCALKLSYMAHNMPHVRQEQGAELPVFLELFSGNLVIRQPEQKELFFVVRGSAKPECSLEQLAQIWPLRSHAVYLEAKEGQPALLHVGAHCQEVHVTNGLRMAELLSMDGLCTEGKPASLVQGDDPRYEWVIAKGRTRAPRLFRLYDVDGHEVTSNQYHPSAVAAFPHAQAQLRDTILVDAGGALWVWSDGTPSTHCLDTATRYWHGREGRCTVVEKNNEPAEFKALFQEWNDWPEDAENTTPEASPPRPLADCLSERRRTFTPAQLRQRESLPAGLDLSRLHKYLNDEDFGKEFGMSPKDFDALPAWKQNRMRQDAKLF